MTNIWPLVFTWQGRTHIFKIHARSMSVERDIRFELLARLCPNSTGKPKYLIGPMNVSTAFDGEWNFDVFAGRCGDPQRVHGGGHVCHQSPQEDCNRERLSRGRQQSHQVLRQIQCHPQIYDIQLSACVDFTVSSHLCSLKKVYSSDSDCYI